MRFQGIHAAARQHVTLARELLLGGKQRRAFSHSSFETAWRA
jgi:hypothetical protein